MKSNKDYIREIERIAFLIRNGQIVDAYLNAIGIINNYKEVRHGKTI